MLYEETRRLKTDTVVTCFPQEEKTSARRWVEPLQ